MRFYYRKRKLLIAFCIITLTFGTVLYFVIASIIASSSTCHRTLEKIHFINDTLEEKLWKSEMYWRYHYKVLWMKEQLDKALGITTIDLNKLWDYFPASFPCPYEVERVGRSGDGGKNVCGFSEIKKLSECLVYSFGIWREVTFEKMILEQTNCTIRMYDILKIEPNAGALLQRFPERITFSKTGINKGPNKTLKAIMDKNQDSFLHILKMDIEDSEWVALSMAALDFPDGLPVSQLQVEIHARRFEPAVRYSAMRNWWYLLEISGLRPFHEEPNVYTPLTVNEYSFLSIRHGMFKMASPLVGRRRRPSNGNLTEILNFVKNAYYG